MAVRDSEPESSLALCKHLPTAQRTAGVGGRAQYERRELRAGKP